MNRATVHSYEMAGGRVVVKPRRNLPLVTIALATAGGVVNEAAEEAGFTGLVARASVKGTAVRSADRIAIEAENMGGSVAPSVGADLFDWQITVPSRHFPAALELLSDVAYNATFPEAEFQIEKQHALADLQHLRDDMYRFPLRLCLQTAFVDHPYGRSLQETEQALANSTVEDMREWHRAVQARERWAFVVGDVDPDDVAQRVAQQVPSHGANDAMAPASHWPEQRQQRVETRSKAQTALALAFPGPVRNDPDVYVLQVLANAVGGLGGRFFEELRSRRSLAYTVALLPVVRRLGGAFVAYIATSPEREDEARSALLEEFARLSSQLLSEPEITRSKRYTIGTWQIRSQTNASQLGDLLSAYMLGPGLEEVLLFEQNINAVTAADILRVAQKYFDPERVVEGVVRGTGASR